MSHLLPENCKGYPWSAERPTTSARGPKASLHRRPALKVSRMHGLLHVSAARSFVPALQCERIEKLQERSREELNVGVQKRIPRSCADGATDNVVRKSPRRWPKRRRGSRRHLALYNWLVVVSVSCGRVPTNGADRDHRRHWPLEARPPPIK